MAISRQLSRIVYAFRSLLPNNAKVPAAMQHAHQVEHAIVIALFA
jgi:hypothetical protein